MSKNIAIIIGSTRPSRIGANITNWVAGQLPESLDVRYEIIDLAEWNLPIFDEAVRPAMGQYSHEHTKKWSAKVKEFDGFVVVSPEYNAGYPAVLKNAIDYLYAEWADKPVLVITYGMGGGSSANRQLREVFERLKMKVVTLSPEIPLSRDIYGENGQIKDIDTAFASYAENIQKAGAELIA